MIEQAIVGLVGLLVFVQLFPTKKPQRMKRSLPKGFFDTEDIFEKKIKW